MPGRRCRVSLAAGRQQSVQQENVGVALGHCCKDRASIRRPRDPASDERRPSAEVGDLTPRAGRCRERPDIRAESVGQRHRDPLAVGRERWIQDLPRRHPRDGHFIERSEWPIFWRGGAYLLDWQTVYQRSLDDHVHRRSVRSDQVPELILPDRRLLAPPRRLES